MPKQPSPENALPFNVPPGWWPCFNVTSETIPGYAHVKFCQTRNDPADPNSRPFISGTIEQINYHQSQELFGGQAIIRVRKVAEFSDDSFHQYSWFTWQHPILPHRFGLCTRNWPARALVNAASASVGESTFPVPIGGLLAADPDNGWILRAGHLLEGPSQKFTCIMMDATDRRSRRVPEILGTDQIYKPVVCWIEPRGVRVGTGLGIG